jgi:hypothetical protein
MKRSHLYYYCAFVFAFVVVGNRILRLVPNRLGQDFVVQFLRDRIGVPGGFTEAQAFKLYSFCWELGAPLIFSLFVCFAIGVCLKLTRRSIPL